MSNVLFLLGAEDSNEVLFERMTPKGPQFGLEGNIDLFHDLKHPDIRIALAYIGGRQPQPLRVPRGTQLVFNCLTDADANRRALQMAAAALPKTGLPVINAPSRVLQTRRDEVAVTLAGIPGLMVPATVHFVPSSYREILQRLEEGPVRYPALIRRAGTHGGKTMVLLRSAADAPLLEQFACDGGEYYLIEFVDFRAADGRYRKIRIQVVDGAPYVRHQIVADDWNVHAADRGTDDPALRDEEAFMNAFESEHRPRWQGWLAATHQRLGLDYFSIDGAALPDGGFLLFEANASGNALRRTTRAGSGYLNPHYNRLYQAVVSMLTRPRTA